MNSLKIKLQKCKTFKRKLNTEKWILIKLMSLFFFLNQEGVKFTSRWSQSLVNVGNVSFLKQKNLRILFMSYKQFIFSVFHSNMVMFC